jgi:DEAD/DEAH box helicase domain-containing protein
MLKKIVFDLETQKEFSDVGGRGKNHLLKVSVCGAYDYSQDKYLIFEERELPKLGELFQSADQLIGFNSKDFDCAVLQPYLNFDLAGIPHLDILEEIEKVLGHRIKLDDIAQATLGSGKSADGRQAVQYFKTGRMEELKKYCLDDVKITREVYEYAMKNHKVLYRDFFTIKEIPLRFSDPLARVGVQQQSVLF